MKKQIIHWLGLGVLMFWLLAGQTVLAAAAQQPGGFEGMGGEYRPWGARAALGQQSR